MVFRSGKYKGYTIQEVWEIDPSYMYWVQENRPEMLKSFQPKPQKVQAPKMSEEELENYNYYKKIRPATLDEAF